MSRSPPTRASRRSSSSPPPTPSSSAIDAGDVAAGQAAYADGRPYYERIEPLVALFPELDGKIDAREDDFPKKAQGPDLDRLPPDRAQAVARRADRRAHGRRRSPPGSWRTRSRLNELMADAKVHAGGRHPRHRRARRRGRGVEDHGRGGALLEARPADLPRQPRGRARVLRALAPLVQAKDPDLADEIDDAFDDAFEEVEKLRRAAGSPPTTSSPTRSSGRSSRASRRSPSRSPACRGRSASSREPHVSGVSRRRFVQGAAGGAAVAAGAVAAPPAPARRGRERTPRAGALGGAAPGRASSRRAPRTAWSPRSTSSPTTCRELFRDLTAGSPS